MHHHGPLYVAAVTVGWCLCSVLGYYAGRSKGRPALGAFLGIALGLFGVVLVLLLPRAWPAGFHGDPFVRLRDAKSLLDRGMISAAEYEMKRQQILREI